jgi:2',3'-cyclic-nucleotide 2'-phosphodiesterase (5'-nucleotidase family)
MISGTADAYFTQGAAVMETLKASGVQAMLAGNLEFTFGQKRLAELAAMSGIVVVASNIIDAETERVPDYLAGEKLFYPGGGLKVGLVGISPPDTPNLTARSNIAGLKFSALIPVLSIASRL